MAFGSDPVPKNDNTGYGGGTDYVRGSGPWSGGMPTYQSVDDLTARSDARQAAIDARANQVQPNDYGGNLLPSSPFSLAGGQMGGFGPAQWQSDPTELLLQQLEQQRMQTLFSILSSFYGRMRY